jgi:hypothetical protein
MTALDAEIPDRESWSSLIVGAWRKQRLIYTISCPLVFIKFFAYISIENTAVTF